jgi:hypothetical protein
MVNIFPACLKHLRLLSSFYQLIYGEIAQFLKFFGKYEDLDTVRAFNIKYRRDYGVGFRLSIKRRQILCKQKTGTLSSTGFH